MSAKLKYAHLFGLVVCVLIGTLIRLNYNAVTVNATAIQGDAAKYVRYATNMLEHGVFSKDKHNDPPTPDAYWAPGYPAFLAGVIQAARYMGLDEYVTILNVQVMLAAATILLTWLLARQFLPGLWPLLPSGLLALSPHHIAIGQNLLTESLFCFTLLLSIALFVIALKTRAYTAWCLAGIAFAMAWFVNPVSLLVAPALTLIIWVRGRRHSETSRPDAWRLGLILIPLLLSVTVWNIRSEIVVPESGKTASDRLLHNAIIGLHPDFYAIWRAHKRDPNNPAKLDEKRIAGSWLTFATVTTEYFIADPAGMLYWYVMQKPLALWGWEVQYAYQDIYIYPIRFSLYHKSDFAAATYRLMKTLHVPLLLFALCGMCFLLGQKHRQQEALLTIAVTLLCICGVYVATQATPRFSFPLRPLFYLVAAFGLWQSIIWTRARLVKVPQAH